MSNINNSNSELFNHIISDSNIYAAIYSLESYITEIGLLSEEDLALYNQLKDKYNDKLITEVIKKCKGIITTIINSDELFDTKVYFKLKKYFEEESKFAFRPIHTCDLITQICMVSMLNAIMFCDTDDDGRKLSEVSKLIPHHFYGNIPSLDIDHLYVKWQLKYKEYSDAIIRKSKEYGETKKFKYEIFLDLKDFYPSINPAIIYNQILKKLQGVYCKENDASVLKQVLIKLLYLRIDKRNIEGWENVYYPNIQITDYEKLTTRGIPQGLPQSAFFANLYMINVAKLANESFEGDAYYYVDDSAIFSNSVSEDFRSDVENLNTKLRKSDKKIVKEKESKECLDALSKKDSEFQSSIKYSVQYHTEGKTDYRQIDDANDFSGGLQYLCRQVSLASAINSNLDDDDDTNSVSKLNKLVEAIDNELSKQTKDSKRKLLRRFRKYFLFRKRRLELRKEGKVTDNYLNDFYVRFKVENPSSLKELSEIFDEEIFQHECHLILNNIERFKVDGFLKKISEFEKKLSRGQNPTYLYYSKDLVGAKLYGEQEPLLYQSLAKKLKLDNRLLSSSEEEKKQVIIDNLIKEWDIQKLTGINYLYAKFVYNFSNEYKRKIYNAFFSTLYGFDLSDNHNLIKNNYRSVNYTELRVMAFIRNYSCRISDFRIFLNEVFEEDCDCHSLSSIPIDIAILGVLHIFVTKIKNPHHVDNLILTHRFVSALWKNGSKFLNAYTLHNEDHAISLIRSSLHILNAIDYLGLKQNDYYVLFLACYLHDISMVIHPNISSFSKHTVKTDAIATALKIKRAKMENDHSLDDNYHDLILDAFKKVYEYFEESKRSVHPRESASYIRQHNKDFLSYLEDSIIDLVALVSESHGYDAIEVYGRKSYARKELFSIKYMMILIRLADLMDMSNERVNYYRLRDTMESLSSVSRFHWISHLITENATIKTDYDYDDEKRLWEHPITETIRINIWLNVSYLANMPVCCNCAGCSAEVLDKDKGIKIKIDMDSSSPCKKQETGCPIICAWMMKKNEWLKNELQQLIVYLNQTESRLFNSQIEINLQLKNGRIDPDMFDSVYNYLQEKRS